MTTATHNDAPGSGSPDELDRLLGDYFKSRMPRPWPAAPATGSAEPARTAVPAFADAGNRARLTLAASFALVFGGYLVLSSGWQPADRSGAPKPGAAPTPGMLNEGTATMPDELKEHGKRKATDPKAGPPFKAGPINLP